MKSRPIYFLLCAFFAFGCPKKKETMEAKAGGPAGSKSEVALTDEKDSKGPKAGKEEENEEQKPDKDKEKGEEDDDKPKGIAQVETELVAEHELGTFIKGFGSVIAANSATLNIGLPRAIIINKLNVVPGQAVVKGETLFESSTDSAGRLAFRQAQVAAKSAEAELTRLRDLRSKQLATTSQVAAAEKALSDAEDVFNSESSMGNGSQNFVFKSPFDGTVVAVTGIQGDHIQPGTSIMQLSGGSLAQVILGVEPDESSQIRPGMEVRIKGALNSTLLGTGLVKTVSHTINQATQLIDVWVDLQVNPFTIGSKVYGDIKVSSITTLAVPRSSVLSDERESKVFLAVDGLAVSVVVTRGKETTDYVEIKGDVKAGDKVIKLGNYVLKDGMTLLETSE